MVSQDVGKPGLALSFSVSNTYSVTKVSCYSFINVCFAVQLIAKQQCVSAEAKRVGRLTVLPLLLSAVLPYAQPDGKSLENFLHAIVQRGMQDDESNMWAVKHIQVHCSLCAACRSYDTCLFASLA